MPGEPLLAPTPRRSAPPWARGTAPGRTTSRCRAGTGAVAGRKACPRSRASTRLEMVREMLRARGIAVSDESLTDLPGIDEVPDGALVGAALSCHDEADLLTRLRRG